LDSLAAMEALAQLAHIYDQDEAEHLVSDAIRKTSNSQDTFVFHN
jgi:hypothetical protein